VENPVIGETCDDTARTSGPRDGAEKPRHLWSKVSQNATRRWAKE
jgi:hypothetical protein